MARLAIIADDLTGALDAAAPFATPGRRVAVAVAPGALAAALEGGAEVVAVSTNSREIGADEAQARVAAVLAALPAGVRAMKKVDSRLKGNLAAELGAFGGRGLLVLPAIPDFGRVVKDGRLSGFGIDRPIDIAARLGTAAARSVVPDTLTQADLAAALRAAPPDLVPVGARGLAQALALAAAAAMVPPLPGPLVFVVGSTDPITLAQVAALRAARPDIAWVPAPSGTAPAPRQLAAVTLVQATPGPARLAADVARALAASARPWLDAASAAVLTGGATAEAVFDALGIGVLDVVGEALPGMPCCGAGGRLFVTKSGGFGAADALVRLAAAVQPAVA